MVVKQPFVSLLIFGTPSNDYKVWLVILPETDMKCFVDMDTRLISTILSGQKYFPHLPSSSLYLLVFTQFVYWIFYLSWPISNPIQIQIYFVP
jgi:hypothetical protein